MSQVTKFYGAPPAGKSGIHVSRDAIADTGAIFFERELTNADKTVRMAASAALIAQSIIPTKMDIPPGAIVHTYRMFEQVGKAAKMSPRMGNIPRADIAGQEFKVDLLGYASSYGYTIGEIESASMAGFPLDSERGKSTARAIAEALDEIAFYGDYESPSTIPPRGLLTHPSIGSGAAPVGGTTGFVEWLDSASLLAGNVVQKKDNTDILLDMNLPFTLIDLQSLGQEQGPNTLLLPTTHYSFISSQLFNATSGTERTILQMFKLQHPEVEVIPTSRCYGISSAAPGSVPLGGVNCLMA
jgi:hypothetical protein